MKTKRDALNKRAEDKGSKETALEKRAARREEGKNHPFDEDVQHDESVNKDEADGDETSVRAALDDFLKNGRKSESERDKAKTGSVKQGSAKTLIIKTAVLDVLLIGVGLVVFALFHHVIPVKGEAIKTAPPMLTVTPTPTAAPKNTHCEVLSTPETDSQFFFDGVFTEGDYVEKDETTYRSKNVSVKLSYHDVGDLRYYVQDVYVRKMSYFKTAFAEDTYGTGIKDQPLNIAIQNDAICAISGDYCGARRKSIVIRNGQLYRDSTYNDICVIYNDGVMRVFEESEFDADTEMNNGAYQAWDFGPNLLDENGKAFEKYNSKISGENPRTAIGYFEPGHYCFIVVDGRGANDSDGLTLHGLAKLFEELGCKAAYNLDGGRTSCMVMYDSMINDHEGSTSRESSDIIMITDYE